MSMTNKGIMQKRSRRKVILVGLFILLVISACVYLVSEGFRHIDPQMALWRAQKSWQDGQIIQSIPQYVTATGMAFEAGARWSIANAHIYEMQRWDKGGHLQEALVECATAVRILSGYDDEGALSYTCTLIEEEIKRQSLQPPTPKPQP